MTRTQGSGGQPGVLSVVVTATNPSPSSGACTPVAWQSYTGTISNSGRNTGNGTWRNALGGQGAFTWGKACESPNGMPPETTYTNEWLHPIAALYNWYAQLNADRNFGGRNVVESGGPGSVDYCHFEGSDYPAFESISGGTWYVGVYAYNFYGPDTVGWSPNGVINYYRTQRPARSLPLPCTAYVTQEMHIQCNGTSSIYYKTNILTSTIDATTVGSGRDGVSVSKTWP